MTELLVPTAGGPLLAVASTEILKEWQQSSATGDNYRHLLGGVGVAEAEIEPRSLQDRAAQLARLNPAVVVEAPAIPELTGDLLADVRAVTGLTYDEIARAAGVNGRTVAMWRADGPPAGREGFLQALRSIGMNLVGGLGSDGVRKWFLSGVPPRIDRLATGDLASIVAEARAYETSPAT